MKNYHEEAFDPEVEYTISEEWRPIKDFEDLYAVSSKGRVKNIKTGRVLKNSSTPQGYAAVWLCKGDGTKRKCVMVHRLMAQAFIENPDNLPQVDHLDENKGNNDVSNLRWVTASQNNKHSVYQRSCKINQYTLDGEFIKTWESSVQIGRELGFDKGSIIKSCKGKLKQAYGYLWSYADPSQQHKFNRPVAALTMERDLICEYKNAAEAARCLKIRASLIHFCLKGIYKSTHGLQFIYID